MAAQKRKPHSALIEQLLADPGAFEFFRAVSLLESHLAEERGGSGTRRVGHDHSSVDVGIGFDTEPSLGFASRQIASVAVPKDERVPGPRYKLAVSFLGLVGPAATLPRHYTEFVIQRLQARDTSLREYLSIFNDRAIAFFYRAWRKYRVSAEFKRSASAAEEVDPITNALLGLTGLLPLPRSKRIGPGELVQAHCAGLFSDRRRSAHGLQALVSGLLRCEARVEQFVGRWIELDPSAWAQLGRDDRPGVPARLGDTAVLGTSVWAVDACVRIIAGPMSRARFRQLWPGGDAVRVLCNAVADYVGPLIDSEFVWELAPDAPTPAVLGGSQQLGRDTWLGWNEARGPDLSIVAPSRSATPT